MTCTCWMQVMCQHSHAQACVYIPYTVQCSRLQPPGPLPVAMLDSIVSDSKTSSKVGMESTLGVALLHGLEQRKELHTML
jgi:hypothetical protein